MERGGCIMATISSDAKVGYIYQDGTWYPIAGGAVNTAATFGWTGAHSFGAAVSFSQVVQAKAGVNNFLNPTARDASITSPTNGIVVFIRQNDNGDVINQIQYYSGGVWINYGNVEIDEKTTSYTIALKDVDKLIKVNSSSNLEVLIPAEASVDFPVGSRLEIFRAGTGEVSVVSVSGAGVTIRSKNNNTKISTQFSGAMLTKIGTDEWHLIGDLKA
jgi:hypothetical protein